MALKRFHGRLSRAQCGVLLSQYSVRRWAWQPWLPGSSVPRSSGEAAGVEQVTDAPVASSTIGALAADVATITGVGSEPALVHHAG